MILDYLKRLGLAIDQVQNVALFNGSQTETVSHHAARAWRDGKKWGCVVCRFLSIVVERNHCAKQLDPNSGPTSLGPALRSLVLLLLPVAAFMSAIFAIARII
jgi:hypothetical protein